MSSLPEQGSFSTNKGASPVVGIFFGKTQRGDQAFVGDRLQFREPPTGPSRGGLPELSVPTEKFLGPFRNEVIESWRFVRKGDTVPLRL